MTIFALHRIEPREGDGRPGVRELELIALGLGVEPMNDEVLFFDQKSSVIPTPPRSATVNRDG